MIKMANIKQLVDGFHKVEKDGVWFNIFKDNGRFYLVGVEDKFYNKVDISLDEASEKFGVPFEDGSDI